MNCMGTVPVPVSSILYRGALRTIEYAIRHDGTMPAKVFFESLPVPEQRSLFVLFQERE